MWTVVNIVFAFYQAAQSKLFQMFDFGPEKNKEKYNQVCITTIPWLIRHREIEVW